jgi:RNA polymerase primary sigma factor
MSRSQHSPSPSNGGHSLGQSPRFRASDGGSPFQSPNDVRAVDYLIQHSIKLDLLTPEQECVLARQRIEADREIALLEKTLAENKPRKGSRIYIKIQDSLEKARDLKDNAVCAFMERNIRLAVKIAGDMKFLSTPLENRVSSALEGLREAALRFDPDKGGKFSTYAGFWARQRIFRDNQVEGRTIQLSVNMMQRLSKVSRAETELHSVYGRAATDQEIGEHLGLNQKQMRAIRLAQETMSISLAPDPQDLDALNLEDHLADPNAVIPGTSELASDRLELLRRGLNALDKRERAIISARFGLNDEGKTFTLEAVGEKYGVTRERIRQLESIALRKLKRAFEQSDTPNVVLKEIKRNPPKIAGRE